MLRHSQADRHGMPCFFWQGTTLYCIVHMPERKRSDWGWRFDVFEKARASCWIGIPSGRHLRPLSIYLSMCLPVYLSIYLPVCLFVWSVYLPIYLSTHLSMHPSIHRSIYPSIRLPIYPPLHLSTHLSSYLSLSLHWSASLVDLLCLIYPIGFDLSERSHSSIWPVSLFLSSC